MKILDTGYRKVVLSASAYIPEAAIPTLKCAMNGDANVVECCCRRSVKRMVAAEKYCGASNDGFDTAIVVKKLWQM